LGVCGGRSRPLFVQPDPIEQHRRSPARGEPQAVVARYSFIIRPYIM
jgi:hypothetical protein